VALSLAPAIQNFESHRLRDTLIPLKQRDPLPLASALVEAIAA